MRLTVRQLKRLIKEAVEEAGWKPSGPDGAPMTPEDISSFAQAIRKAAPGRVEYAENKYGKVAPMRLMGMLRDAWLNNDQDAAEEILVAMALRFEKGERQYFYFSSKHNTENPGGDNPAGVFHFEKRRREIKIRLTYHRSAKASSSLSAVGFAIGLPVRDSV